MSDTEQRFVEIMSSWLVSLPHDLKMLYEAAADENLDRSARELAVGTIIYVISPNDFISADRHDHFLSYCDDCLLLRMTLTEITSRQDEDTEFFKTRFAEFFSTLDEELAICEQAMGELYGWLHSRLKTVTGLEYKGKTVAQYLNDEEASEFLYEDGLGFGTEYDVDEETLADSFKRASTVLDLIQKRKDQEDRKTG